MVTLPTSIHLNKEQDKGNLGSSFVFSLYVRKPFPSGVFIMYLPLVDSAAEGAVSLRERKAGPGHPLLPFSHQALLSCVSVESLTLGRAAVLSAFPTSWGMGSVAPLCRGLE